jgi:multiple sugar transport system ATP-binding protein
MASVHIRDVHKHFGSTHVIRGVDIDIADGEFAVLVGPSGCGKSTLLRMIAGLEEITEGEIAIGGKVVNDMQPKERDIAMVFQNYALYPHMKVRDNMAFSMLLAKRPRAEIDKRVNNAAEILGLTPLLDRYPRQLSGGQRQRVAMGRCIVRDPQVFLFDEPLSNLDAKLRVAMRTELKELHQRLKTTSVYVTHDQIEAMTMADQIVVMRDGLIEQKGRPLDLYDRPANLFVAGFIGSPAMNFLPGKLLRANGALQVELTGGVTVPAPRNIAGEDGQAIVLGTRPEHMELGGEGRGLKATVIVVEPTGADTQVFTKIGETEVTAVFRERHEFRAGDAIRLVPDHERTHLFDAESGKSLNQNRGQTT